MGGEYGEYAYSSKNTGVSTDHSLEWSVVNRVSTDHSLEWSVVNRVSKLGMVGAKLGAVRG